MIDSVSADFEHEIPNGSRLYFGDSAALKRKIENTSSQILIKHGFSEILTPFFSYHQHLSVAGDKLLKFSDPLNHEIALRADSTVDVVRIVRKRLKNENLKRLFYIQPTFKYPSKEFYQIGAELIDESNLSLAINIAAEIFKEFEIKPYLQLSNIEIPKIVCKILNMPISVFEKGAIEIILSQNIAWLNDLARATSLEDVKNLQSKVPEALKKPLQNILDLKFQYDNIRVSLLYYSKMRYYDELFFRFLDGNFVFCNGGNYEIDGVKASGFALLSDALIEKIMQKD